MKAIICDQCRTPILGSATYTIRGRAGPEADVCSADCLLAYATAAGGRVKQKNSVLAAAARWLRTPTKGAK